MRLNDEIDDVKEVRLIDEDGNMQGVVAFSAAMSQAKENDLDLCEISPNAEPPVCRIMDYGKFLYQQKKKEHDNQRKHKQQEQKQIKIKSFRIDPHDVEIKQRSIRKFIETGHRVLILLQFRARENDHPELGRELLEDKFFKPLSDVAKMDSPPRKEGKKMTMVLAPVPNLTKVLELRKKELEKSSKEIEVKDMDEYLDDFEDSDIEDIDDIDDDDLDDFDDTDDEE